MEGIVLSTSVRVGGQNAFPPYRPSGLIERREGFGPLYVFPGITAEEPFLFGWEMPN
jgi:hypothetical protein